MATYTKNFCTHQTLAAATADTVNLSGYGVVLITNRGTSDIYCTFAKGSGTATAAVSGADDTYIVQAGTAKPFDFTGDVASANIVQISLISSGTPAYSVETY